MALKRKYAIVLDGAGDAGKNMKKNIVTTKVVLNVENGKTTALWPAPFDYFKRVGTAERIYIIASSAKLSGAYDRAKEGRGIFLKKFPGKKIHIFDSKSGSVGEGLAAEKIKELEDEGESFERIIEETEEFIDKSSTYFVLGDLSPLKDSGNPGGVKNMVSSILDIEPVLCGENGEIVRIGQTIGSKRALSLLAEKIAVRTEERGRTNVLISHANAPENARRVADCLKGCGLDTEIIKMGAASAYYAGEGAVVAAF